MSDKQQLRSKRKAERQRRRAARRRRRRGFFWCSLCPIRVRVGKECRHCGCSQELALEILRGEIRDRHEWDNDPEYEPFDGAEFDQDRDYYDRDLEDDF